MAEWLRSLEPLAYGPLGLKPTEFADLTPREFRLLAEGENGRQEQVQELLAWLAANVMAPHLKHPVQPWQLLGRPPAEAVRKRRKKG